MLKQIHKGEQLSQSGDNREIYLSNFESFEKNLNGGSKSYIHSVRQSAIEQFGKYGFPTTKDEEWRFTNIRPLTLRQFSSVNETTITDISKQKIDHLLLKGLEGNRLVFLNGFLAEQSSEISTTHKNIRIENLSKILKSNPDFIKKHFTQYSKQDQSAFTSLNNGFMNDGAVIVIPDNTIINEPFYIAYISTESSTPFITHPRTLIIAGNNSQASFVEHYIGPDKNAYFTNAITEISADEGAILTHIKIQTESINAYHIGSTFIHQNSGSNVTSNSIMIGGSIARNNLTSTLDGERIECTMNGLSLSTDEQLIDNHTTINHAKPNCISHELYKSILDGKSKGVFNGKIFVRKDAQKTDAKQTNKTLLLSDNATMNTKPQLEIFADDVKCTHGATVGYLDADSIFYLRSRGIDEAAARDILTYAFANDVVNRIPNKQIQEYVNDILHTRLNQSWHIENF